ncbi:ankyrin [Annulohypoxylon bovei var. microspora]|nr:ankyrin [Annulohypoxylon bovei var. microspora]
MQSKQIASSIAKKVSDEEWNGWQDFIYKKFLVEGLSYDTTLDELRQRNPHVTLGQLRTKINQWGFHKNLSAKDWQYIGHRIQERTSQGKDSAIILAGIRFTSENVKKQTERHKVVTLYNKFNQPPSPRPPDEELPLYICTPRATSPVPTSHYEWPKKLPWTRFNETLLPELMSGLRLLPDEETRAAVTASDSQQRQPRKKRRTNVVTPAARAAFENLVRRSMEIVIGSEELTHTLLLKKSVDRIASRFDEVILETYHDENLRRAVVLSGGARSDVQKEILKIFLFLISNRLIMNSGDRNPYIPDAQAFVDIFRFSGLAEPYMLSRMVELSRRSPTLSAVIDRLYEAAVNTETVDLVVKLLKADDRIDVDRPIGRVWWNTLHDSYGAWSGLEFALLRGSLELAYQMIQAGAVINYRPTGRYPLLELAMCPEPDVSIQLIQLLLKNGLDMKDQGPGILHLAIAKGSIDLIDILHKSGVDSTSICLANRFDTSPIWFPRLGFYFTYELECLSILSVAASFLKLAYRPDADVDHRTALRLVKHILNICGPDFDIDNKLKSEAMIFAAGYGSTEIVSFLYQSGAQVNAINGFLSPVYAAVENAQVECCRLLIELGGSAQADWRPVVRWDRTIESVFVSPLHAAVSHNSCELVDLLLQSGVDVNTPCDVNINREPFRKAGFEKQVRYEYGRKSTKSPLEFAVEIGSWEVALLLLDWGATSTNCNLSLAAEEGQSLLIGRFLELIADSDKTIPHYYDVLEASIRNGHESIALQLLEFRAESDKTTPQYHNALEASTRNRREPSALHLLESGVPADNSTMSLALRFGQYHIIMKLVETGSKLTGPELAAVFRIPDASKVQSLIKHYSPNTFIRERSQDGRSFLETAVLSHNIDVIQFALSLDTLFYDSGALCAVTLSVVESSSSEMIEILGEIIRRRDFISQPCPFYDRILEDTAISIAAHYDRVDIIKQIGTLGEYTMEAAVIPDLLLWKYSEYNYTPEYVSMLVDRKWLIPLATLKEWDNWHDPNRILMSPLFLAIKNGSETAVETLLDLGYKPDAHSLKAAIYHDISTGLTTRLVKECTDINGINLIEMHDGDTPLHIAASRGRLDLVKVLLDTGAKPNSGSWQRCNKMLCEVISRKRSDILDILCQSGIDINRTPSIRKFGDTPLQTAASFGYIGIVRRLLACGADPNAHGAIREGMTALEAAAKSGRLDTVQLLLELGATTEGRGQLNYLLAVHRATENGYSAVAELLRSHRVWTEDDREIFRELERQNYDLSSTVFIHRDRYTREDTAEVLMRAAEMQKKIVGWRIKVVEISFGNITEIGINQLDGERQTIAKPQVLNYIRPGAIMLNNQEDLANGSKTLCPAPDILQKGTETLNQSTEMQIILPDTDDTADLQPQEEVGESHATSDTDMCFEKTGGSLCTSYPEPHDEAVEDQERRCEILADMLGEREAPFRPTEWK